MEVRTGDIPTPFKRALEQVNGPHAIDKAEEMIDNGAQGMHRAVKDTEIEMIVKLADSIEAINFLTDNGVGMHAEAVLDGLYKTLFTQMNAYSEKYRLIPVSGSVRAVCKELGIWRAE
jgi:5'-deoxynucleotidase YfbR-like HD superfamily hydrolase